MDYSPTLTIILGAAAAPFILQILYKLVLHPVTLFIQRRMPNCWVKRLLLANITYGG